ncbi:MAG TPA: hypothetical protein VFK15_09045 [Burkholderiales bacterium]|nr:hypothetical protein [Burkholderiales bacterium]
MADRIIAGNFESGARATEAVEDLLHSRIAPDQVCVFFLNPPGQHASYPVGGDRNESPGSRQSDTGALKGAAVGGAVGLGVGAAAAAGTAVLGPIAALAALGVGAYTGSLAGALSKSGRSAERDAGQTTKPEPRRAGMVVAIRVSDPASEARATEVLQRYGARDIERAEGTWRNGKWEDFDPLSTPQRIEAH